MEKWLSSFDRFDLYQLRDLTEYMLDSRIHIYKDEVLYDNIWYKGKNIRLDSPYSSSHYHTSMVECLHDIKRYNTGFNYILDRLPSRTWKITFKWYKQRSINIYLDDESNWYTIHLDRHGCTLLIYFNKRYNQWAIRFKCRPYKRTQYIEEQEEYGDDDDIKYSLDTLIKRYKVSIRKPKYYEGDSLPWPKTTMEQLDKELDEYMKDY